MAKSSSILEGSSVVLESSSADEVPLDLIRNFSIFMLGNSCSSVAQPPATGPESRGYFPFGTADGIQASLCSRLLK